GLEEKEREKEYLEYKLPEKCMDILDEAKGRFQVYDYLLIDEVQDFSSAFLYVAIKLLKNEENVFMVGDAGQKLFDREHSLRDLDMVEERALLPRSYRMYRNPPAIARLAWSFLLSDPFIVHELKEQGYDDKIKFRS